MTSYITGLRRNVLGGCAIVLAASATLSPALADQKRDPTKAAYAESLQGKKVTWVAVTMGNDLQTEWDKNFREIAESVGMEYSVRDANFNAEAQSQAMEAVINEHPDLLIVQSINVNLLARGIKRAEAAGIPVVQLNMKSLQDSAGFVGADYVGIGEQIAEEIVKECAPEKGRTGKVALIQGDPSGADSYLQMEGINRVFADHPEIEIVANQAGMWDPNKARDITATVLQQNPDLCAAVGMWGVMSMGVAQAIKEAGLQGKVLHYSNDGGSRYMCDAVKSGAVTKFWSYNATGQARDVMQLGIYLLQNPGKWEGLNGALFSPMIVLSEENVADGLCYDPVVK